MSVGTQQGHYDKKCQHRGAEGKDKSSTCTDHLVQHGNNCSFLNVAVETISQRMAHNQENQL